MTDVQAQSPIATPEEALKAASPAAEGVPAAEAQTTPEAPKKDDPLSPRFAALAKKQKQILAEQQRTKQILADAEKRLAELAAREAKLKEFEELNDPLEVLKRKNWTYEDVTNRVLNGGKPAPEEQIRTVDQKVEAWIKQQEEEKRKTVEAQKQAAEAEAAEALEAFKGEINEFLSSKPDDYELITLHGQQDLVLQTIQAHFDKTKKVMNTKEAADLVEKYIEEQVDKTLAAKKIKSKLAPPPAEDKKEPGGSPAHSKTLSNAINSTVPSSLPPRTEQERLQRAMAALSSG